MTPDAGLGLILNRLATGLWIAVGTTAGAFAVGNTALRSEIARNAVALYSVVSPQYVDLQVYFTASQAVGTLQEIGVFDAGSGGNALVLAEISPADVKTAYEGRIVTVRYPVGRA